MAPHRIRSLECQLGFFSAVKVWEMWCSIGNAHGLTNNGTFRHMCSFPILILHVKVLRKPVCRFRQKVFLCNGCRLSVFIYHLVSHLRSLIGVNISNSHSRDLISKGDQFQKFRFVGTPYYSVDRFLTSLGRQLDVI